MHVTDAHKFNIMFGGCARKMQFMHLIDEQLSIVNFK